MVTKRAVKKVEIADDNVVDLKEKNRGELPAFRVHKIVNEQDSSSLSQFEKPAYQPAEYDTSVKVKKFDPEELQQRMESFAEKLERAVIKVSPAESHSAATPSNSQEPKDFIKVKFDKFVQLVASRDFFSVLEKNKDEDIVISSNLLTELAGAVEEKTEKKSPVIFLVGLAIGVVLTYLLVHR